MTALEPLPFGAESPDEFLLLYANGALSAEERERVDRWLTAHPEWRARLDAYRAIGSAVRQGAASSSPPAAPDLSGVWAAIDSSPQPRPLGAGALSSVPPPPPISLSGRRNRWASWPLAIAALLLVAMVAVSVVVAASGGEEDTALQGDDPPAVQEETSQEAPSPGAVTDATGGPEPTTPTLGDNPALALRRSARATIDQRSAIATFEGTGRVDVAGTALEGLTRSGTYVVTLNGEGEMQFPDRSSFEVTSTVDDGYRPIEDEPTSRIEIGDRAWVRCGDGEYVEETATTPAECTAIGLGASLIDPQATVDLLEQAEGDITRVGSERINGVDTTHYQFETSVDMDEMGAVPMTIDVWVGLDDELVRQITFEVSFELPYEVSDGVLQLPVTLEAEIALERHGTPVEIEPPD